LTHFFRWEGNIAPIPCLFEGGYCWLNRKLFIIGAWDEEGMSGWGLEGNGIPFVGLLWVGFGVS